jgi:hypothetical protein
MKPYQGLVAVAAMLGILANYLPAQTRSDDAAQREYVRKKLSIEAEGRGLAAGDRHLTAVRSWKKWQAYEGFFEVSEPDFLRIAGYPDEAEKAQRCANAANSLFGTGVTVSVTGLAVMIGGGLAVQVSDKTRPLGYTLLIAGSGVASVGLGFVVGGGIRRQRNWAPLSLVESIAAEHNAKLRARLGIQNEEERH